MPVALHVASNHRSVENVERSEQGRRPVAFIVVGHGRTPAALQWKAGLGAVKRLDLVLLVNQQHDCVRRRRNIEANNIVQLFGKCLVLRQFEDASAMRREAMIVPDLYHRRCRGAYGFGHRPHRPMGDLMVWRLQRQLDDLVDHRLIERGDPRRSALVLEQAINALSHEALLPAPHARLGLSRRRHDRLRAKTLCHRQNDPGSPNMFLGRTARGDDRLKPFRVLRCDLNMNTGAHATVTHAPWSMGIQNRNHPFRPFH